MLKVFKMFTLVGLTVLILSIFLSTRAMGQTPLVPSNPPVPSSFRGAITLCDSNRMCRTFMSNELFQSQEDCWANVNAAVPQLQAQLRTGTYAIQPMCFPQTLQQYEYSRGLTAVVD